MAGQNPGMSVSRANPSVPVTSQPSARPEATSDPQQVSFGTPEGDSGAEGLSHTANENRVKTFGASKLTPNAMRFEKPSAAASLSPDEMRLQTLKQELEPLLEEQHTLAKALENGDQNPQPGMTRGQARRRLRQLNKQIDPLWQAYTPLRQTVFDAKRTSASQAHMQDFLVRYQQEDVVSRDEIRATASPKAQNALDAIDYYSTTRSIESMENDPDRPQFNLTEGMGLVHTRMMANFIDGDKTAAAEVLFDELAQNPDMRLTRAQEQLLESYGIVPNGKGELINYGSQEVVSAADFEDLSQIIEYQKAQLVSMDQKSTEVLQDIGNSFRIGSTETFSHMVGAHQRLASGALATNAFVSQALMAEMHYDSEAEALANALQAAKAARAELESKKTNLMKGLSEVENGIESAQEKLGVLENTIDAMSTLSTQEEMVSYLQNASPKQKALLDSAGITLQAGANGQQSVTVNGQPWQPGSTSVGDALAQEFARIGAEIDALGRRAEGLQTEINNVDEALLNANTAMSDLETRLQSHGESFSNYQEQVDNMRALRDNPEQWNALSAEEQQAVNDFLARAESKISRGRELQNEGRSELTKLRETIADTEQVLAQARVRLADVIESLSQLQQQHHSIGAKVHTLTAQRTEADQKASDLIQKADALAREVELAPQPSAEDVGALIAEWQTILKESAEHFNALAEAMSANQRIESERLAHYAAEAKELQEYTQQYLQDATELSKSQIQRLHDRIGVLAQQVAG